MARRWKRARSSFATTPSEGSFSAWYFEHRLPIAPERYSEILRSVVKEAGAEDARRRESAFSNSRRATGACVIPIARRRRASRRSSKDIAGSAEIIARGLDAYRAGAGSRRRRRWRCITCWSASTTGSLTGGWPPATSTIGAFSTSTRLPACGSRIAGTFDAIHRLVEALIAEGKLQGLRLDHIDGLRDPAQYFQRLRRLIANAQADGSANRFTWWSKKFSASTRSCMPSPASHGTTGYEWLNAITQVLVDGNGLDAARRGLAADQQYAAKSRDRS